MQLDIWTHATTQHGYTSFTSLCVTYALCISVGNSCESIILCKKGIMWIRSKVLLSFLLLFLFLSFFILQLSLCDSKERKLPEFYYKYNSIFSDSPNIMKIVNLTKLCDCNITVLTCFWYCGSNNFLHSCLDWVNVQHQIFVIFSEDRLIAGKTRCAPYSER